MDIDPTPTTSKMTGPGDMMDTDEPAPKTEEEKDAGAEKKEGEESKDGGLKKRRLATTSKTCFVSFLRSESLSASRKGGISPSRR